MKILIVDDDKDSRLLLKRALADYENIHFARGGAAACDALRLGYTDTPYHLIFLDINMPMMDGHETLREIRKIESDPSNRKKDRVKVIMTSNLSDSTNVMESIKQGCDGYLVKPITKEKVKEQFDKMGLL